MGKVVETPWGSWRVLAIDKRVKVKILEVEPEKRTSLQSHAHRAEWWYILEGVAEVQRGLGVMRAARGSAVYVAQEEKHRLGNVGAVPLRVIEIQTGEVLSEEDIIRYEDDFGRVK